MKASEIIRELQDQIDDVGDLDVVSEALSESGTTSDSNFVYAAENCIVISDMKLYCHIKH